MLVLFLVLRLLLVLLVVRALLSLARGVLEGYRRMGSAAPPATKLVRDPVCGVFVSPAHALTANGRGELKYFCSEHCRRQWGLEQSRGRHGDHAAS